MITKRYNTATPRKSGVVLKSKRPLGTIKKKLTAWRTSVFTRHPSHSRLRTELSLLPFRSVVRLGSTTPSLPGKVECNTIQGVKNSSSKLLMKQCFTRAGVKTADWFIRDSRGWINWKTNETPDISELPYPIIAKSHYGSRGDGNTKLDSQSELEAWMRGKTLSNYIFERYFEPNQRIAEYRIHCTQDEYFYACRKMLKKNTPEEERFQRHSDNCVWITEDSTTGLFDKPNNWDSIVQECIKALKSLNLDIGAFDLKVQAKKDSKGRERLNPEFIIIESCSAPSLMEKGISLYLKYIPIVLRKKAIAM